MTQDVPTSIRLLVTGGAGFIGSHLCEKLLSLGHSVVCVDNLLTGTQENFSSFARHDSFQFLKKDLSERIEVDGDFDAVLHFASPASPVDYQQFPIQTLKVGARGTHHALGLALAKRAKFLLASTSEIYGDPQVHPQTESYWGHVNPIGPRGVYDEAKRFAEALTMAYHRVHGMQTYIIRIFNTYGPRMRMKDGRVVPTFIRQALEGKPITLQGDGSQSRSFCYIDDLVEGILKLLMSEYHEPMNIGNTQELTVRALAEKIVQMTGSSSKLTRTDLPVDDPHRRRPDIQLAQRTLGWSPSTSLEEGLSRTIDWAKGQLGNRN